MPTQKECHVCKKKIGVASKTCAHCGAKQPYKQKLENIKRKLSHGWKERQKKNSSVNKVYDATNLLLHKWELLERHPMLLLARRTTRGFLAECFCPWQMNAEDGKDALAAIKRIYESLLNVALPAGAAGGLGERAAADSEEPSAPHTQTPPPDPHVSPSNSTADPASESMSTPLLGPQLDTHFTFAVTPGSLSLASALPPSSSSSSSPQIPPVSSSLTRPVSSLSPPPSSSLAPPVSPTLSASPKPSLSPASTQLDSPGSGSPSWTRTQERQRLDPNVAAGGSRYSRRPSPQQHFPAPPPGSGGVPRPDKMLNPSSKFWVNLRVSSQLDVPGKPPKAPWRHPNQMPKPLQRAPFELKDEQLCSELQLKELLHHSFNTHWEIQRCGYYMLGPV